MLSLAAGSYTQPTNEKRRLSSDNRWSEIWRLFTKHFILSSCRELISPRGLEGELASFSPRILLPPDANRSGERLFICRCGSAGVQQIFVYASTRLISYECSTTIL